MKLILMILLLLGGEPLFSQSYPKIKSLYSSDVQYAQLTYDISNYYKAKANNKDLPGLVIRQYTPQKGVSLIALSSLLSLPYESLASLNRISSNITFDGKRSLLIPNLPFLFLPEKRSSDLELMVFQGHEWEEADSLNVHTQKGISKFYYIDEQKYSDIERSYFLGIFRFFPVPKGRITSHYGLRKDPFHGQDSFHGGIDIAAPMGTDVICPLGGTVTLCEKDHPIYGNYLEIQHNQQIKTRYGHLSRFYVKKGDQVSGGTVIGAVGSTGRSTGPHLHFEYLKNDKRTNPQNFLKF